MAATVTNNKGQLGHSVAGIHASFQLTANEMLTVWDDAKTQAFQSYQQDLLTGKIVNYSENRAAWHTAFRDPSPIEIVAQSMQQVKVISDRIRADQMITDVVNIGIGGSDLGPKLICEAFADQIDGPNVHFISNLDNTAMQVLLKRCSPKNTLFIATSKSFCTLETIENLHIAMEWLQADQISPEKHVIAITNNTAVAKTQYKIPNEHIFEVPEWIGGRFSLWTAVGLSIAIAFGFERFYQLHQGAQVMDAHFASAPIANNLPVVYATQLWQLSKTKAVRTLGILPYADRLKTLPAYLQQLFMESLGKQVDVSGKKLDDSTGPVVFGGVGTNIQHSFQQLMMQGTHAVVADFILPLWQAGSEPRTQALLTANCLAQINTLRGGFAHHDSHKAIPGQQTANLLVIEELTLKSLGALLAFYEHAVVTIAYLLNINPFDQWGVEHAKQKSNHYFEQLGESLLNIECLFSELE